MIWLLAACVLRSPMPPPQPVEAVLQFKLQSPRGTMAGLAAIAIDREGFELQALSPAGIALFTVSTEGVRAPDPAWARVLEQLPFERDLRLMFAWDCPAGSCAVAGGGRVRQDSAGDTISREYRGPAGPATAVMRPGRRELVDGRRGYTLTLVGVGIGGR